MAEVRESTYFILAALIEGPLHGYGIVQTVRELSEERVQLSAGTLYGALERLADEGLVEVDREEVVGGRPRRYHRLSGAGREALAQEAERLRARARVVQQRLREVPA